MNWGKEEDKLSPTDFEMVHNIGTGCRLELEDLGFCLGLDDDGKRVKLPIIRLKCIIHDVTSRKFLREKEGEK
jgi:hypothetical protein